MDSTLTFASSSAESAFRELTEHINKPNFLINAKYAFWIKSSFKTLQMVHRDLTPFTKITNFIPFYTFHVLQHIMATILHFHKKVIGEFKRITKIRKTLPKLQVTGKHAKSGFALVHDLEKWTTLIPTLHSLPRCNEELFLFDRFLEFFHYAIWRPFLCLRMPLFEKGKLDTNNARLFEELKDFNFETKDLYNNYRRLSKLEESIKRTISDVIDVLSRQGPVANYAMGLVKNLVPDPENTLFDLEKVPDYLYKGRRLLMVTGESNDSLDTIRAVSPSAAAATAATSSSSSFLRGFVRPGPPPPIPEGEWMGKPRARSCTTTSFEDQRAPRRALPPLPPTAEVGTVGASLVPTPPRLARKKSVARLKASVGRMWRSVSGKE